jgi:hypothetical protein
LCAPSAKTENGQDEHDDYDQSDEIDDGVHGVFLLMRPVKRASEKVVASTRQRRGAAT